MLVYTYLSPDFRGERPSLANLKKLKKAMPKLDKGYNIYRAEVLPWLQSISTHEAAELTGLSRRYIQYLKNGVEKPGAEALEKLIQAMNTPRKGKEWEDDLYPRFMEISVSELIRLTGFSRSYIGHLRNKKRKPSEQVLEKLRLIIQELKPNGHWFYSGKDTI